MITDCAISTGSTHPICQDYARSGEDYVILSDGCSDPKSPDTDIGSRLIVLAAEHFKKSGGGPIENIHKSILAIAAYFAEQVGLKRTCLDATLLTIWPINGKMTATIFGDGAFFQKIPSGLPAGGHTLSVTTVSYPDNFPFYPNYLLPERTARPKPSYQKAEIRRMDFLPNGQIEEGSAFSGEEGKNFWSMEVDPNAIFAGVTSDGIGSFIQHIILETSKETQAINNKEILPDLLGFKSFNPGFVKRRMQRFEKDLSLQKRQHYDDLSIAAIAFKDEV